MIHLELHDDNKIAVVTNSLKPPELYLAIWHGGHSDLCGSCALQGDCHALFDNGKTCKIYAIGERWVRVNNVEALRKLLV